MQEARGRGLKLDAFAPPSASRILHPHTVGAPRFELGTSALSGLRSNQLSYAPARQQAGHFKCSEPSAEGVANTFRRWVSGD